eukprot:TRINITY_DN26824_c0_g1_i1.p1 TRINITY_DN26824_c0_g1~~TRINITY_DN26824_c0_g1_i1.p1  ORF type:complete len:610 (+),score=236.54 TRINITY_DN26824_c0_g1_i1:40-1830(+)
MSKGGKHTWNYGGGKGHKGHKGGPQSHQPVAPDVMWPVHHNPANYSHFTKGEEVSIFYRYEYDGSGDGPEAYFPVSHPACGQSMPRIGRTDCWQPAVVIHNFNPESYDPRNPKTGVSVRLLHPTWYNRHGNLLDVTCAKNTEVCIHPADIVRGPAPRPMVSFVVVRWGGHYRTPDYNELSGEEGGWGSMGTSISDGYIRSVFDRAYLRLGNTYEVLTCYVQSKHDLDRLTPSVVIPQLNGEVKAGCYFLWPIAFVDGSCRTPGYVEKDALFKCMSGLEIAGIETSFPHPAMIYKTLVSKDWCSFTCIFPEFRVPATTKVMRSSIHRNSREAADTCLAALQDLTNSGAPITKGVAKLGYSWEASDVLSFKGSWDLAKKLEQLVSQPGCEADNVIVQEFIPSDLEIRCYCIEGRPVKLLYTKFCENTDEGSFTSFKSVSRDYAIAHWFGKCEQAMTHAESEICRMVRQWMRWIRGLNAKLPSFLRLDFFVKREGVRSSIFIGEITEAGASCLGWADGWTATFDAVLHAAAGIPFPHALPALAHESEYDERFGKGKRHRPTHQGPGQHGMHDAPYMHPSQPYMHEDPQQQQGYYPPHRH